MNYKELRVECFFDNFYFNEKFMVKQKLMVTDLTVPLNVGEWGGYLALIQSTFL